MVRNIIVCMAAMAALTASACNKAPIQQEEAQLTSVVQPAGRTIDICDALTGMAKSGDRDAGSGARALNCN